VVGTAPERTPRDAGLPAWSGPQPVDVPVVDGRSPAAGAADRRGHGAHPRVRGEHPHPKVSG